MTQHFQYLQNVTTIPKYGSCWTKAVEQLPQTCNKLTEETQANLALQFTHCFMAMTTDSIDSDAQFCQIGDRQCIQALPERIFQVFTTFYAHTQSICFYLMSQIWHDETEQTIDSLRIHSKSVSQKLEFAGRLQANMLEQQREGLKLQRHLIEHGLNLSNALSESRQTLFVLTSEFRNSTIEHTRLLGELFGRLRLLHNWFVGEYAFVNQILYYIGCIALILLLTTSERSSAARFILFGCTGFKIFVEYLLTTIWFLYKNDNNDSGNDDINTNLFYYVWCMRKCFAVAMIVIYVRIIWMYIDRDTIKMNTLIRITKQNEEILELLKKSQDTKESWLSKESPNVDSLNRITFCTRIRKRSEETVTESTEDLTSGLNKVDNIFNREGSTYSTASSSRYPIRIRKRTKLG